MPIPAGVSEYTQIRKALKPLLEGIVLSIDPSCGSTGSMPGWAVSREGKLVASGTIQLDYTLDLPYRLQALQWELRKLHNEYSPDVLVFEQIAPRRYGGGSAHGHASLLKAVGVTISMTGPTQFVGLRPPIWTKQKSSSYVKGDEADAREMLRVALETARYIAENDMPRKYGGEVSTARKRPVPAARVAKGAKAKVAKGKSGTGKTVARQTATRQTRGKKDEYKQTGKAGTAGAAESTTGTASVPRADKSRSISSRKKPATPRG